MWYSEVIDLSYVLYLYYTWPPSDVSASNPGFLKGTSFGNARMEGRHSGLKSRP